MLCGLPFTGIAYLFVDSEHLVEEFRRIFGGNDRLKVIFTTSSLYELVELQPLTCLQCWFNGERIVGSFVTITKDFKMAMNKKFNGDDEVMKNAIDEYTALGFRLIEIKAKTKAKSVDEMLLSTSVVKDLLYTKLINDLWFLPKIAEGEAKDSVVLKALELIKAATSSKEGFIYWVIDSYLSGGIRSLEDLGRVKSSLSTFNRLIQRPDFTDFKNLGRYCGLSGCNFETLAKYDAPFRTMKTSGCTRETCGLSLEDLIEKHSGTVVPTKGFLSELPRKDIIFEDGSVIVSRLSSQESAKQWGRGTRWCTAAEYNNMFDFYNGKGVIYVITDKLDPYHKRYQLHLATKQYMDVNDSPIDLKELMKLYPSVIQNKSINFGPVWKPDLIVREAVAFSFDEKVQFDGSSLVPDDLTYGDFSIKRKPYDAYHYDDTKHGTIGGIGNNPITETTTLVTIYSLKGIPKPIDFKNVESITIWSEVPFKESLEDFDFGNVKDLTIYSKFNQPIERLDLGKLKRIEIASIFNQPIERIDLKDLEELILRGGFNQPIEALDLKKLKSLRIDGDFNQSIIKLDLKDLEELVLLGEFNQSLVGLDLKKLKRLVLGPKYSKSLVGMDFKELQVLDLNCESIVPFQGLMLGRVNTLVVFSAAVLSLIDYGHLEKLEIRNLGRSGVKGFDLMNIRDLTITKFSSSRFGELSEFPVDLDTSRLTSLTISTNINMLEKSDLTSLKSLTIISTDRQEFTGERIPQHILEHLEHLSAPLDMIDLTGLTVPKLHIEL